MLIVGSFVGESLDEYLARSIVKARDADTAVQLQYQGTPFVVTAGMSVVEAATAWRRAHDSEASVPGIGLHARAGRYLAP